MQIADGEDSRAVLEVLAHLGPLLSPAVEGRAAEGEEIAAHLYMFVP
jgi:hypothetical protein